MTDKEQHDRKLTGEQREFQENLVHAALCKLSPSYRLILPSDLELLVGRLKNISEAIAGEFREFDKAVILVGTKHDPKFVAERICKAYLNRLSMFTRDELLFILAIIHTEEAMNAISGTTNNIKFIKSI